MASGYHDLTTTFFGVEYTFDHSGIDKDRITLRNYPGGHMMYLHAPSLAQLSSDIGLFLRPPSPREGGGSTDRPAETPREGSVA